MKVQEILKITKGLLLSGDPDVDINPDKISTDSRTIEKGGFFIGLKGTNFDGGYFLESAFKKGAVGAIATNRISQFKGRKRILIQVKDATKALQDIASHHRIKFDIEVIGVTGSNGKTAVKEMLWSILSTEYNVLKNEGTKNNHIGLPQTLLKLKSHHDICILEMGMNHRGEIGFLSKLAKPTIAVITNIGPSHLEYLGSLQGVFEAKMEILEYLDEEGLLVLNGDDKYLSRIRKRRFDIIRFGFKDSDDFRAKGISIRKNRIRFLLNDKMEFVLNLLGVHNIYNALAAIAVASHFGVSYESMKEALSDYRAGCMRLDLKNVDGIEIIDDSYNSNPLSMECALEALKDYPAKARWVVSGDMLELGRYGRRLHKVLGDTIARSDVDGLVTFGRLSRATLSQAKKSGMDRTRLWHCSAHDEVAKVLRRIAKRGDAILIKGSRAMKMEEIIEKFKIQNSKLKT